MAERTYTRHELLAYGCRVAEETLRQAQLRAEVVQHFVERPHIEISGVDADAIAYKELPYG